MKKKIKKIKQKLLFFSVEIAAQLVGAEGNVAPGANEEEELIQKLGEYLDATGRNSTTICSKQTQLKCSTSYVECHLT